MLSGSQSRHASSAPASKTATTFQKPDNHQKQNRANGGVDDCRDNSRRGTRQSHVLALPAIVLRNDQQDALGIGLGVTEYAPRGKSAEEIRALWRWICARLSCTSQPGAEAPAQKHAPLPAAVESTGVQLRLRAPAPLAAAQAA